MAVIFNDFISNIQADIPRFEATVLPAEIETEDAIQAIIDAGDAQSTADIAQSDATDALNASATNSINLASPTYLSGRLSQSSAAIIANSSEFITVGSASDGVVIGSAGIFCKKAGVTQFSVDNSGNAVFKGDISGSSGNFTGQITSSFQIVCQTSIDTSSKAGAIYGYASGDNMSGVLGHSTVSSGVFGQSTMSGRGGVYGINTTTGGIGGLFYASVGQVSLYSGHITNLISTTYADDILPITTATRDLGSSTAYWANVYASDFVGTNSYIQNQKTSIAITGSILPTSSGYALGSSGTPWSNLYCSSISSGSLGATTAYINLLNQTTKALTLLPNVDDGYSCGSSSYRWGEMHGKHVYFETVAVSDDLSVTDNATIGGKLLKSVWADGILDVATNPDGTGTTGSYYYRFR